MPKTTNLRSQLINLEQAGNKSFVITVAVWEAPGSVNSPGAVRFQFVSHKNPALWWRLTMTSARKGSSAGRDQTRYTNAQYNKALRTATDAMNQYIVAESDTQASSKRGSKVTRNPHLGVAHEIPYGTVPDRAEFNEAVEESLIDPFLFKMELNPTHSDVVERAAEIADVQLLYRKGRTGRSYTAVASPASLYSLVQALTFMSNELGNRDAGSICEAILQKAGFRWVR